MADRESVYIIKLSSSHSYLSYTILYMKAIVFKFWLELNYLEYFLTKFVMKSIIISNMKHVTQKNNIFIDF